MPEIIPNTESGTVATLAIAWEIARITHVVDADWKTKDEGLKEITNSVIKVYKAILDCKPIE